MALLAMTFVGFTIGLNFQPQARQSVACSLSMIITIWCSLLAHLCILVVLNTGQVGPKKAGDKG